LYFVVDYIHNILVYLLQLPNFFPPFYRRYRRLLSGNLYKFPCQNSIGKILVFFLSYDISERFYFLEHKTIHLNPYYNYINPRLFYRPSTYWYVWLGSRFLDFIQDRFFKVSFVSIDFFYGYATFLSHF